MPWPVSRWRQCVCILVYILKNARLSRRMWQTNSFSIPPSPNPLVPSFAVMHVHDQAIWNLFCIIVWHQIFASLVVSLCFSLVVCWNGGVGMFQYRGHPAAFFIIYSLACYATLMMLFVIVDVTLYTSAHVIFGGLWP